MVVDIACEVGEGPLWHSEEKVLYWTDIPTGRLYRYNPRTGAGEECHRGRVVGGFTIQEGGALLLFHDEGAIATWQNGIVEEISIPHVPQQIGKRFNDVIADPAGRVFCGTLGDHRVLDDVLYRLDTDGALTVVEKNIGTSNGMGFSPDKKKFYFTDTTRDTIYVYDFWEEEGAIGNRRVFADLSREEIKPDGLTVDSSGDVWSAMALGGCVIRFAPDGSERERISFPVKMITSVAFGGENLDTLYATTGMGNHRGREWGEKAGALFQFFPGVVGLPEYRSRVIRG
jgi:D-xylonolactonase